MVQLVSENGYKVQGLSLTFAAAEVQTSQSILESLLEAQELQDRQVDGRMESEATLVRAKGRVILNSEATIDLQLALVVLPDDSELNDSLRDGHDIQCRAVLWVLLEQRRVLERAHELCKTLDDFNSCDYRDLVPL